MNVTAKCVAARQVAYIPDRPRGAGADGHDMVDMEDLEIYVVLELRDADNVTYNVHVVPEGLQMGLRWTEATGRMLEFHCVGTCQACGAHWTAERVIPHAPLGH